LLLGGSYPQRPPSFLGAADDMIISDDMEQATWLKYVAIWESRSENALDLRSDIARLHFLLASPTVARFRPLQLVKRIRRYLDHLPLVYAVEDIGEKMEYELPNALTGISVFAVTVPPTDPNLEKYRSIIVQRTPYQFTTRRNIMTIGIDTTRRLRRKGQAFPVPVETYDAATLERFKEEEARYVMRFPIVCSLPRADY
jgi:hypothetical protein